MDYNMKTMSEFVVDSKTGVAYFPALSEQGVQNGVTFDNASWGNMNDGFAGSELDKARIATNDMRLAQYLGVQKVLASRTPIDAGITHVDPATAAYLLRDELFPEQQFRLALIHANAVILTAPDVEVVFAPRDCAIVSFVHPNWQGTLLVHIGAHMLMQNLHIHAVGALKSVADLRLSEVTGYVTPHICAKHYSIDEAAYERFLTYHPGVEKFLERSETGHTARYWFDFVEYMKESLESTFGLNKWVESGICTYESAQQGNLFSKRLTDSDPERYPKAGFNVAFAV